MRYTLSAIVTISVMAEVEASSPEEAERLARLLPMGQINDSSRGDVYCWHAEELDGMPNRITVEGAV